MKKISGTSKRVTKLIKDETYYDPTRVRFENSLRVFSSAVPDWDKAKVFNLTYSITPTYQGDDCSGYAAITHPNGDQMFIKYDGSWKWVLPRDACRWNGESKGQFIGGIGKFEGIKGVYTSNLKGDGKSSTGEWEVEYEIASICSRSCSSG